MMRGDAYSLPIRIETTSGTATADSFEDVEISIGKVKKKFSTGEITYDTSRGAFLFPLTQKDTFSLHRRSRINIRCKFPGGDVIGIDVGVINITPSLSSEVI